MNGTNCDKADKTIVGSIIKKHCIKLHAENYMYSPLFGAMKLIVHYFRIIKELDRLCFMIWFYVK